MSEYKKIIDQVVFKSKLEGLERERLEEEMRDHFEDAEKDYLTKGKSKKELLEDFGDPVLIGQQIRIVKRRWEKIPILGNLIYYPLFRAAVSLGLVELILVFISPVFILVPMFTWEEIKFGYIDNSWWVIMFFVFIVLIPLAIVVVKGFRIYKLVRKVKDLLFLMLLSIVPIISLLMIFYVPNLLIKGINSIWISLRMQLIGLVLFQIIYFVSYLISRFIKKYVR